jgi:hypothetical protein
MSFIESLFFGFILSGGVIFISYINCKNNFITNTKFNEAAEASIKTWWPRYIGYSVVFAICLYFTFFPWWSILIIYAYAYFDEWLRFTFD